MGEFYDIWCASCEVTSIAPPSQLQSRAGGVYALSGVQESLDRHGVCNALFMVKEGHSVRGAIERIGAEQGAGWTADVDGAAEL